MEWTVHGSRTMYSSDWVGIDLVDVELPSGQRFEHHVVRVPKASVVSLATDPERGMLMIHRHRFISDRWGWELPAGWAEEGEVPAEAAARELLEETGWRAAEMHPAPAYQAVVGLSDHRFHPFWASGCVREGEPSDTDEADRIEWVGLDRARRMINEGEVDDGISLSMMLWFLLERPDRARNA